MVIDPRRERFCDGYAAQTMFYQSQVYPTENKPDFSDFFISKNKQKVFKKSQNFTIWLQKAKLATLLNKN